MLIDIGYYIKYISLGVGSTKSFNSFRIFNFEDTNNARKKNMFKGYLSEFISGNIINI